MSQVLSEVENPNMTMAAGLICRKSDAVVSLMVVTDVSLI